MASAAWSSLPFAEQQRNAVVLPISRLMRGRGWGGGRAEIVVDGCESAGNAAVGT